MKPSSVLDHYGSPVRLVRGVILSFWLLNTITIFRNKNETIVIFMYAIIHRIVNLRLNLTDKK